MTLVKSYIALIMNFRKKWPKRGHVTVIKIMSFNKDSNWPCEFYQGFSITPSSFTTSQWPRSSLRLGSVTGSQPSIYQLVVNLSSVCIRSLIEETCCNFKLYLEAHTRHNFEFGLTSLVWPMTQVTFSGTTIFTIWPLVPEISHKTWSSLL